MTRWYVKNILAFLAALLIVVAIFYFGRKLVDRFVITGLKAKWWAQQHPIAAVLSVVVAFFVVGILPMLPQAMRGLAAIR